MSDLFDALRLEVGLGTFAELLHRPAWMADALCAEPRYPISWFFGDNRGPEAAQAIAVCRRCAVRAECLEWAIDEGPELAGIWGAQSQRDRRRVLAGRVA